VEERLGVKPQEVNFVSSNGFDIAGAKRFGFRVARIARLPQATLAQEVAEEMTGALRPVTFYKALRTQEEALGYAPDFTASSLADLSRLAVAA